MATDDLTLVKRVRSGDQRAFKLLVERYQRKVYAVALGMLKDKEEAMDVSQEAFVKVYKYLDHFKGDASFYTWLYRITVNICIDVMRKRARRGRRARRVRRDDADGRRRGATSARSAAGWAPTPRRARCGASWPRRSRRRWPQVPEKHRAILLLREVEGMSYEDLSRTLEIPKGTVMSPPLPCPGQGSENPERIPGVGRGQERGGQ